MSMRLPNPASMGGPELHRFVCAWCARTGTNIRLITDEAGISRSQFDKLANRAFPRPSIGIKLLSVISTNPDGLVRVGVVGRAASLHDKDAGAAMVEAARDRAARAAVAAAPAAFASIADEVAAEAQQAARRRAIARASMEPLDLIRSPSPAEAMATMCVQTPGELIATVQRQWPSLWARTVEAARSAGTMPGAMLAQVIERGLDVETAR